MSHSSAANYLHPLITTSSNHIDELSHSFRSIHLESLKSPDVKVIQAALTLKFRLTSQTSWETSTAATGRWRRCIGMSFPFPSYSSLMQHYEECHQDIFPISPIVPLMPITCVPFSQINTHNTRSRTPVLDASHSIRIHISSSSNSSRPGTPDITDGRTCKPTDIYNPRQSSQTSDPERTDSDTDDCLPTKKRVRVSKKEESDTQYESDETSVQPTIVHTPINPTPPPTPAQRSISRESKKDNLSIICPLTGIKKYICKVQICQKQYKNANGLKYHLQHAHSDGVGLPPNIIKIRDESTSSERPYLCTIIGCTKRYKNLNGLKVCNLNVKIIVVSYRA